MKKRHLAITTATIMSLAICTTMSSILPFSIAAEDQVAPNLAFSHISFKDGVREFEYSGEEITPEFTVYVGVAEVPAQAYTYTVISADGDGTSAGTNAGQVTFQLAAVENPIFYGETTWTFTITKANGLNAETPDELVVLSPDTYSFNLDEIILNKEDCGIRSYTLGDLSDSDEIMSDISIDGAVLTYSANPNAAGTAEQEIIVSTQNYNDVSVNIHFTAEIKSDFLCGDVNADGVFSVADVILLQKWLLSVPDTHLANWKAADFYEDGKLDVFDLCLMKRMLIYGDVPPMTVPTQALNFSGRYSLSDKMKSLMSDAIRELTDNSDLDDFTFESRICSNIVDDDYNFIGERYVFWVYYKDLILNPDIYSLEIQYYYDDNINIYGDFLNAENINKVLTADLNFYQSEQDIIKTGRDYCDGLEIPTEDSYGYDLGVFNPSSTFGDRIRKMIYSLDDVIVSYEITDSNYGYEYIEDVKNGYVDLSTDLKIYIDAQTGEIIVHDFNVIMDIS